MRVTILSALALIGSVATAVAAQPLKTNFCPWPGYGLKDKKMIGDATRMGFKEPVPLPMAGHLLTMMVQKGCIIDLTRYLWVSGDLMTAVQKLPGYYIFAFGAQDRVALPVNDADVDYEPNQRLHGQYFRIVRLLPFQLDNGWSIPVPVIEPISLH